MQLKPNGDVPDDGWAGLAAGIAFVLSVSLSSQIYQSKSHTKIENQGKVATVRSQNGISMIAGLEHTSG
jgi:hypothetical protein